MCVLPNGHLIVEGGYVALSCHEISPVITAVASLEKRSVSNLIEVMADERWKRLVEQQGVAYAKTVAEAMKLKLDMDNPADREKLRLAVLDLVAGKKPHLATD